MTRWLDAHTHLDSDELFPEKENVLDRALESGVERVLLVNSESTGTSFDRTLQCIRLQHPVRRFACFGVHPHHASQYDSKMEEQLKSLLQDPAVIGFGEIGLDFYYNFSPQDVQMEVFRKQLALAKELNLPVIIHCRDAYRQLAEILKETNTRGGMIHCFTGTVAEMQPLLELGFTISFSGIVTFKKATDLQEAARAVPMDRVLVETDAPFLAPVPFRGKRNEPAFVVHTAKFVAELKGKSEEEFAAAVNANFEKLFQLDASEIDS
jgi:TatD DNase family protein